MEEANTKEFLDFLKSVREFCETIESEKNQDSISFLRLCQKNLIRVYSNAHSLQTVELEYNVEDDESLSTAQIQSINSVVADKIGFNRYYWFVFNPADDSDNSPVCGDLLSDIVDIYKDLKSSLLTFEKQTPGDIESALWTFDWGFKYLWGDLCSNAIYALHYFIKRGS